MLDIIKIYFWRIIEDNNTEIFSRVYRFFSLVVLWNILTSF